MDSGFTWLFVSVSAVVAAAVMVVPNALRGESALVTLAGVVLALLSAAGLLLLARVVVVTERHRGRR